MKIAYLIIAHNTPQHTRRLVKSLSSESSWIYIHLDKKSSDKSLSETGGENVCFIQSRIPVYWGDYSFIEATLILLRTALSSSIRFDRFVLLSGADYPLRSASEIERFFANHSDVEFISSVPLPSEGAGKPLSRLNAYIPRPGSLTSGLINKLMQMGVFPYERDHRKYLQELQPYGGSAWWALSREACLYILDFVEKRKRVVKFFKNMLCSDESLVHTILGNSPFRSKIVRSLTYVDWSEGGNNPAYISEKHLDFFRMHSSFIPDEVFGGGTMLFARKFSDDSVELVAKLDAQIREKNSL